MSRKTYRVKRLEQAARPKEDVIRVWISWSEDRVESSDGQVLTQAQFDALYPDAIVVTYDNKDDEKEENEDG